MKVLFITDFILAKEQGAKQLTKAHLETLKEIFGTENVDIVSLNSLYEKDGKNRYVYVENAPSKAEKLMNIISGSSFLLSKRGLKTIVNLCKHNNYSMVFVDHSIYGEIVKGIKQKVNIPIVTFFHGIMQYQNIEYAKHNDVSKLYRIPCANMKVNETLSVEYSDLLILLNSRDNDNLKKFYNKIADGYLPFYLNSNNKIEIDNSYRDEFKLLFVGGYFWPNVHGIAWFVENVMPRLPQNIVLDIVGNGMEKLSAQLASERVRVRGRVDCLDDWYNDADVVVGPIFEGEGMKTKTCEALMYGKVYLGTEEAICGFDGLERYQCNTKEEFINLIERLNHERPCRYNSNFRKIYEKNYSSDMAKQRLIQLLNKIGIQV